jgi:hypothetical protein
MGAPCALELHVFSFVINVTPCENLSILSVVGFPEVNWLHIIYTPSDAEQYQFPIKLSSQIELKAHKCIHDAIPPAHISCALQSRVRRAAAPWLPSTSLDIELMVYP